MRITITVEDAAINNNDREWRIDGITSVLERLFTTSCTDITQNSDGVYTCCIAIKSRDIKRWNEYCLLMADLLSSEYDGYDEDGLQAHIYSLTFAHI